MHACDVGRATRYRSVGLYDAAVTLDEVKTQIKSWKASPSLPPDLLPRIVFKLPHIHWDNLVFSLIRLTGPGALACRPVRWKYTFPWTKHKSKSAYDIENFRRLWIRVQMGLLQEAVLSSRIKTKHMHIASTWTDWICKRCC